MRRNGQSLRKGLLLVAAFPAFVLLSGPLASLTHADDWPQWLGAGRNGRVSGFTVPKEWPKELKQKWKTTIGDGVATPALVKDKLYVFTRESNNEVTRCLEADTGKEVWIEKYATPFSGKGDSGFQGPRSSPAVVDGKVVTFGVNGTLSCLSAAEGKKLWRVETGAVPMFHTSSSPVVVDDLALVQFGNERAGGVAAYTLAEGKAKWKWTEEGTAYASPALLTVDGVKMIVAATNQSVVGISTADGKLLWKTPFQGGMRAYNAATPMVEGQTVVIAGSGRGTKAIKIEKKGDKFVATESWASSTDFSPKYNTPVINNELVFGLTERNVLYCLSAKDGKVAWDEPVRGGAGGGGGKGGFGGGGGYGSIVNAGTVMMVLTPAGQLIVFEPTDKDYKELASYRVGNGSTYAYPIVSGNRVYIKDRDSVICLTIE